MNERPDHTLYRELLNLELDGCLNLFVNRSRLPKSARCDVKTLDGYPILLPRQLIVNLRGRLEMGKIGFLQIAPQFRVVARTLYANKPVRLCDG